MPKTKDTSASALQKKKRSSEKFFGRSPEKNIFQKIFQALHKLLTTTKIVLSSSRGQANFRGLEASRPRPGTSPSRPRSWTSNCVLKDSTSVKKILLKIRGIINGTMRGAHFSLVLSTIFNKTDLEQFIFKATNNYSLPLLQIYDSFEYYP